jgi:hypothetical protein
LLQFKEDTLIEFERHLEYYSTYSWSSFSKMVKEREWGDKKIGEEYLKKYWLSENEYKDIWKPRQSKIFINEDYGLPELIFPSQYNIIALRGGCLFSEEDFKKMQKCLQAIDEKYFVIIQNSFAGKLKEPAFRMKFPTTITWEELTSGNYISAVLFEMPFYEYFVFGETDIWGKYSANDYEYPLDLIGCTSQSYKLFNEIYKESEEERNEIREWLPPKYRDQNII